MYLKLMPAAVGLLLFISGTQLPPDRQVGSIKGIVLDEKNNAIPGARVYDEPIDSARIGKDHFVETDQSGRFYLTDVPIGRTMVIATNTDLGYPDARFALFSGNEVLPTVEVKAGQITSDVVVKLLAKGGVLKGKILDSLSGLPVRTTRITLSRVDHPEWPMETNPARDGTFKFVIPARPMHFEVRAPGYKTWTYGESALSKGHSPLAIAPGATQEIDIYLERVK
jgi:hypothetical protein